MEKNNQRRRNSPRISAQNANKETHEVIEKEESQTKTKAKRKFSHLATKYVSEGRSNSKQHKDNNRDQSTSNTGKSTELPEKRILELVIDILQKRDVHEIFAEPVDSSEVENYYEIIKEPMDFGTMRAKLHEGMYENLEQFEHDAFLIPNNAMHFNSPSTIYFRQARCILDLAKKVFHVLRTDPENFEMEFSGTRRRSMRKMQNETKESKPLHSDVKVSTGLNTTLLRLGPQTTNMNKDRVFLPGVANGCWGSLLGEDSRRSTYLTWKLSHENDCSKQSILLHDRNISYRESLTRFVEDLGPTAKKIAAKKLQVLLQPNNTTPPIKSFQVPTAYATFKMPALISSSSATPAAVTDKKPTNLLTELTKPDEEKEKHSKQAIETIVQCKRKEHCRSTEKEKIDQSHESAADLNKKMKNSREKSAAGSSVIVDTRKPKASKTRPIVIALEYPSQATAQPESRPRKSQTKSQNKAYGKAEQVENKASSSKLPQQASEASAKPMIPRFTFDMPFLKTQLSHMSPAAAHAFDSSRLLAPRDFGLLNPGNYLRFGNVMMNRGMNHQDVNHQQIPLQRPLFFMNNGSSSSSQPPWPYFRPLQ